MKELVSHLPETLVAVEAMMAFGIFWAFSKKQKDAIKDRDDNRCQATVKHECDAQHPLEIDHIIPQRYAKEIGIPDPDFPENALTKCRTAHDIKHPDRIAARQTYHQGKDRGVDTFHELFEERRKKLENRELYWNTENDRTDFTQAVKRTQKAKKRGWQWPWRKDQE